MPSRRWWTLFAFCAAAVAWSSYSSFVVYSRYVINGTGDVPALFFPVLSVVIMGWGLLALRDEEKAISSRHLVELLRTD